MDMLVPWSQNKEIGKIMQSWKRCVPLAGLATESGSRPLLRGLSLLLCGRGDGDSRRTSDLDIPPALREAEAGLVI